MVIVARRSMEPTYRIGDVVVTWRDGRHVAGDPVLFRVPDSGVGPADSVARGARVIHRLVDGGPDGWVTQGDNVPHPDIWEPTDTDILGRAVLHLPGVGEGVSVAALAASVGALHLPHRHPVSVTLPG